MMGFKHHLTCVHCVNTLLLDLCQLESCSLTEAEESSHFFGSQNKRCDHGDDVEVYLRPSQQQLLETFHLFAVVCCPLLDRREENRGQTHRRRKKKNEADEG